jgi:hypothetical protein
MKTVRENWTWFNEAAELRAKYLAVGVAFPGWPADGAAHRPSVPPVPPAPVEVIDDTVCARQRRRSLFRVQALMGVGAGVILFAVAAVILALWLLGHQGPPVVNIAPPANNITVQPPPAPVVNVTMPKQEAPVVNVAPPVVNPTITVPPAPPPVVNIAPPANNITVQPPTAAGSVGGGSGSTNQPENKVATDYIIFHNVKVDPGEVQTGWRYHNSNETTPYNQYCLWMFDAKNYSLTLAENGVLATDLTQHLSNVGLSLADATRYAAQCKWFDGQPTKSATAPRAAVDPPPSPTTVSMRREHSTAPLTGHLALAGRPTDKAYFLIPGLDGVLFSLAWQEAL